MDGARKRDLIQHASVFALASLHENFGVSVLEALASGVPVFLSSEVDLADAVRQERAGWVVEPTADALAAALPAALADAPTRGAAARARYLSTFSPAVVLGQLIAVYADLAGTTRRR